MNIAYTNVSSVISSKGFFLEKNEELIPASAAFETNDTGMFPRVAFQHSMTKRFPA